MDAVPPTTGRMTRSTHIKYIQWHMAISARGEEKAGKEGGSTGERWRF